jgi:hypothetical protein
MAVRKAQMFVVTAVFLVTMLFTVQQAFIAYTKIDTSAPFKTKQVYVLKSIIDSVNDTITTPPALTCQDFEKNIDELLAILRDDISKEGYLLDTGYLLDCGNWTQSPSSGTPPFRLTIRFSETYDISGNVIDFYHSV